MSRGGTPYKESRFFRAVGGVGVRKRVRQGKRFCKKGRVVDVNGPIKDEGKLSEREVRVWDTGFEDRGWVLV